MWLHDRGYSYIGDASLYRLTLPEMARLYNGWRTMKEAEAAQRTAAMQSGSNSQQEAANPHRKAHGQPRDSDWKAMREFGQPQHPPDRAGAGAGDAASATARGGR